MVGHSEFRIPNSEFDRGAETMKTKNLIILAAVVITVLAYIMLFERHRPTSDEATAAAEKVLLDFERDDVTEIVIGRAEGRVRLEKMGEGWRLREPLDFPADSSVGSPTLGSLANLTADRTNRAKPPPRRFRRFALPRCWAGGGTKGGGSGSGGGGGITRG